MEVAQRALFAGAGTAKRVSARCDERRGQVRLGSVCSAVSPPGLCLHCLVDVFVSCFQKQRFVWPVRLQRGCLGRCSSFNSVSRRELSKSAAVRLPRSWPLKVSRFNQNLRSSNEHANANLRSGFSGSLACFASKNPRGRSRCLFIYAGIAAGSGSADESRKADLPSSLLKIGAPTQDTDFSTGTRTVTITVCGVTNKNDLRRLKSQVEDLDGVGNAWLGTLKQGGLRRGSVTLQIERNKRVPLPALIRSIQALDDALLILPFKSNSWLWRGNKINYSVSGCGKPLILVHGFGGNVGHFARLIPFLAESHRVYAIDLLGFGASDKPLNIEYGPDLWAELVCDFAKEFAGEGSVLFGNSIGSLCVLAAAAKAGSDIFKGVILLNCAGAMNRKGLAQDGLVLRLVAPIFVVVEWLLQQPKVANSLFNKFRSKDNVKQILQQQAYRDKEAVTDQLVDILHHPSNDEGALAVFVKVFTGEPGPRPEVMVPKINVPLLVLWGEKDPWTPANGPISKYFRRVAAERDNAFVKILPDVGHCPHDDRPELAAGEILPFLERYNL